MFDKKSRLDGVVHVRQQGDDGQTRHGGTPLGEPPHSFQYALPQMHLRVDDRLRDRDVWTWTSSLHFFLLTFLFIRDSTCYYV